jgi:hypothetical protein
MLEIAQPLVEWVRDWAGARGRTVWLDHAEFGFRPYDDTSGQAPSHVTLNVAPSTPEANDGLRWVVTEAWWSADVPKPRFNDVARWSLGNYVKTGIALGRHLEQRRVRLSKPADPTEPPLWARGVDLVNLWLLTWTGLYWAGFAFALPFILLLLLLSQVPLPAVQKFALVTGLQNFLDTNMADMEAVTNDQFVAADLRQRVWLALEWLAGQQCDELFVIAHSGGAVLAFESLCDRDLAQQERPDLATKVRKLFTLGEGLNKALEIAPDSRRLNLPLDRGIVWVDFWSAYDPVPVTRLDARFDSLPGKVGGPLPRSIEVTNQMDLATDHGLYWSNDEQVLAHLAGEIEPALAHMWPATSTVEVAARARRERVSLLVALRLWAILLALATMVCRGLPVLQTNGATIWGLASALPGVDGVVEIVAGVLDKVNAPGWVAGWLASAGYTVIGAAVVVAIFWLLQQVFVNAVWDEWDTRMRRAFRTGAAPARLPRVRLAVWPLALIGAALWLGGWPALAGAAAVAALLSLGVLARYLAGR